MQNNGAIDHRKVEDGLDFIQVILKNGYFQGKS